MSSNDSKFQKVWNFAEPPQQYWIPFNQGFAWTGIANTQFSFSGINDIGEILGWRGLTLETDDLPTIYSNSDIGMIIGNDTGSFPNADVQYSWRAPTDLIIMKTIVRCAVAVSVSAYTSGNFGTGAVLCKIGKWDENFVQQSFISNDTKTVLPYNYLTATGTNLGIYYFINNTPFMLSKDEDLIIDLESTAEGGGGTAINGFVNVFPISKDAILKPFYTPGMMIYAIPNTDANRAAIQMREAEFK